MKNRKLIALLAALLLAVTLPTAVFAYIDPLEDFFSDYDNTYYDDSHLYTDDDTVETTAPTRLSIKVGESVNLNEYIRTQHTDEDVLQWRLTGSPVFTARNPDIVSVTAGGVATGHRVGVARITATSWDNTGSQHIKTFVIGVGSAGGSALTSAAAGNDLITITDGKLIDMAELAGAPADSAVQWSTGSSAIATVNSDGLLTTQGIGRTTVTAAWTDAAGAAATRQWTVRVTSIYLDHYDNEITITLAPGQQVDLFSFFYPTYLRSNANSTVTVSTSNSAAAAVSGYTVTAGESGSATVTITREPNTGDTQYQRITIRVS